MSKGGTVFTTLEPEASREVTTEYQVVLPGEPERRLFPLAFCRECGQEYLLVRKESTADDDVAFRARHTLRPADGDDGYLYISADRPWPANPIAEGRLPSTWISATPQGPQIIRSRRLNVPRRHWVNLDGAAALTDPGDGALVVAWIPGAFRFCMGCGVSYETPRSNEFAKLVTLDREGRSSAMSVVSSSVLTSLREMGEDELPDEARKLLAFVDNRQDASLQAGHFNDFVQIVQLRAALHQAAKEAAERGADGLSALDGVHQGRSGIPHAMAVSIPAIRNPDSVEVLTRKVQRGN